MIILRSEKMTPSEIKNENDKIQRFRNYGYPLMTILHFISEEGKKVSATYEGQNFVITIS